MTASTAQRPRPRELAGEQPPTPAQTRAHAAGWVILGLAGSVLLTLTGSRLADRRFHWWFRLVIDPVTLERVVFYAATVALVVAWLGLGRVCRSGGWRPSWMSAVAFIWCVPLLAGPP